MPAITFTTGGALKKSALRQANERLVLNAIRQNESISRADIVRVTGLSPSSVTFIVKRLKREKLVGEEKLEGPSQVGRQPTSLRLQADARLAMGVEITLSGARIVLVGLDDVVLAKRAVAWHSNHAIYLDRVHSAIRALAEPLREGQLLGVGVSLPGNIDRITGRVIAAENLNWIDVEAGALLRRDLDLPFLFENMAKLSALAEMWLSDRDPQPLRNFIAIVPRAGLGTGVVINGQILQGASSAASECGHIVLYPEGRRCQCGNKGCWEQYVSDLALSREYAEQSGRPEGEIEARQVVELARGGDQVARKVLNEVARDVGLGLVNLTMAFNPEAFIVGDYLGDAWDLIEDAVWSVLRARVPSYFLNGLRIAPSRHGTDSPLAGATALVLSNFFSRFEHGSQARPSNAVQFQASV
ncbi:MAG: ROK family transcriptional regulator [Bryobacteraceae bacterium]